MIGESNGGCLPGWGAVRPGECVRELVLLGSRPGAVHSAQSSEQKCRGQPTHQDACQSFHWAEQPPLFRQHEIPVPDRRVRDTGKVERRLGIRQTLLPPEE